MGGANNRVGQPSNYRKPGRKALETVSHRLLINKKQKNLKLKRSRMMLVL